MKKIGVLTNRDKDAGLKYTRFLIHCLCQKGAEVRVTSDISEELELNIPGFEEDELIRGSEAILCLGGDGTFLKVARKVYKHDIPILGVNLGTLGFLTEVDKNDIENAVDCLMADRYTEEKRMMLEMTVVSNGVPVVSDIALNDVVVSRGALSRILHVRAYINGAFADSFPGDGIIVSSPTGSTAYSLSVGGPIVEPDIDMIILSPICPHILYSRSFITAGDREVKVVVDEEYQHSAMVTVDGQEGHEIHGGDTIEVRRSKYVTKILRVKERNFFNVLRTKIYYRGESLRENEIQQTFKNPGDHRK